MVPPSRLSSRLTLRFLLAIITIDALLFGAAGRIDWTAGWWLTALFAGTFMVGTPWLVRHDPGLLEERMSKAAANVPEWDRWILGIYRPLIVGLFVTAALDAGRTRWSAVPLSVQVAGGVAMIVSLVVIWRCLAVNHFLASYARIQNDRGHVVVQDGPYRYVRHPMYTAIIVLMFGIALLLGSWLALVPATLIALLFVVRTRFEDRMLTAGLDGYRAYALRVPKRLVPGMW